MTREEIISSLPVHTGSTIKELREYATAKNVPFLASDSWNTILYKIREDAILSAKEYYRIQTTGGRILEHVECDSLEIDNYLGELSIQYSIPVDELYFETVTGKELQEESV